MKLASVSKPVKDHIEAANVLSAEKVLGSPEFWEEHAVPGQTCPGEYVATLIQNFTTKSK